MRAHRKVPPALPGSYSYLQPKAVVYIVCVHTCVCLCVCAHVRVCLCVCVCVCVYQSVSSYLQTWLRSELPQVSTYSCQ